MNCTNQTSKAAHGLSTFAVMSMTKARKPRGGMMERSALGRTNNDIFLLVKEQITEHDGTNVPSGHES